LRPHRRLTAGTDGSAAGTKPTWTLMRDELVRPNGADSGDAHGRPIAGYLRACSLDLQCEAIAKT